MVRISFSKALLFARVLGVTFFNATCSWGVFRLCAKKTVPLAPFPTRTKSRKWNAGSTATCMGGRGGVGGEESCLGGAFRVLEACGMVMSRMARRCRRDIVLSAVGGDGGGEWESGLAGKEGCASARRESRVK